MKWKLLVSDSLWPYGLYSPWNPPGQNTGVGSLSLLQGIFPNPGIEPMSPALQADYLPAEPQGKPHSSQELGKVCIKCTYITLYYAVTYDSFVAQSYKADKIWSQKI